MLFTQSEGSYWCITCIGYKGDQSGRLLTISPGQWSNCIPTRKFESGIKSFLTCRHVGDADRFVFRLFQSNELRTFVRRNSEIPSNTSWNYISIRICLYFSGRSSQISLFSTTCTLGFANLCITICPFFTILFHLRLWNFLMF